MLHTANISSQGKASLCLLCCSSVKWKKMHLTGKSTSQLKTNLPINKRVWFNTPEKKGRSYSMKQITEMTANSEKLCVSFSPHYIPVNQAKTQELHFTRWLEQKKREEREKWGPLMNPWIQGLQKSNIEAHEMLMLILHRVTQRWKAKSQWPDSSTWASISQVNDGLNKPITD